MKQRTLVSTIKLRRPPLNQANSIAQSSYRTFRSFYRFAAGNVFVVDILLAPIGVQRPRSHMARSGETNSALGGSMDSSMDFHSFWAEIKPCY